MNIDLVRRISIEKSRGNLKPYNDFNVWLQKCLKDNGTSFVVASRVYFWKIVSAVELNYIINDDETDWMLIYSEDSGFQSLSKVHYQYSDLVGKKDMPVLGSFWLFQCHFEGLVVDDEPIQIMTPHWFTNPIHRIDNDFVALISKLRDSEVEIIRSVDYKIFKVDTLKIR